MKEKYGKMDDWKFGSTPLFHHSIIPVVQDAALSVVNTILIQGRLM
jgi:hypothetical protein